jgi:hypothetical protein
MSSVQEGSDPRRADDTIELNLSEVAQLFNSLDPSPLRERDLDRDAEEFIVSWARELPPRCIPRLVIRLENPLPVTHTPETVGAAVRHYFAYRASFQRLELGQLFKQGRLSLLIGVTFLTGCLLLSQLIAGLVTQSTFLQIQREGLTIGGWVAMWRPMEIYLYDWWPIRRRARLLDRLSRMEVELRFPRAGSSPVYSAR